MQDIVDRIPLYLNGGLIQELSGLLIDGYIQTKSLKCTTEGMGSSRLEQYFKNTNKIEKDKNPMQLDGSNENLTRGSFDGRAINREEYSISRTYATFSFFRQVRSSMNDKQIYNKIDGNDILKENVKVGSYVEFAGSVTEWSYIYNIGELIDIISCYDVDILNKLLPENSITNYAVIIKQLTMIKTYLNLTNTFDIVMNVGKGNVVLNVHGDNFINKTIHNYDLNNCNCTVMGKVVKSTNKNECIDLLRKSCNGDFFRKLIENMKPYFDVLKSNGIILPEIYDDTCYSTVNGPSIQVIPIAIYH